LDEERAALKQIMRDSVRDLENKATKLADQIVQMREQAVSFERELMGEFAQFLNNERESMRALVHEHVRSLEARASQLESKLRELLGGPFGGDKGEVVDLPSWRSPRKNVN
jgi:protein subunit release factor A